MNLNVTKSARTSGSLIFPSEWIGELRYSILATALDENKTFETSGVDDLEPHAKTPQWHPRPRAPIPHLQNLSPKWLSLLLSQFLFQLIARFTARPF
jgi:hypothetical protein